MRGKQNEVDRRRRDRIAAEVGGSTTLGLILYVPGPRRRASTPAVSVPSALTSAKFPLTVTSSHTASVSARRPDLRSSTTTLAASVLVTCCGEMLIGTWAVAAEVPTSLLVRLYRLTPGPSHPKSI